MNDTQHPELADWEKQLIGDEPTVEEQQRLDSEAAAAAAEEAGRREAWPMLHDGSATVDLSQVWYRLWDLGHNELYGIDLVDALADEAGGVAKRFAAGAHSLMSRRDENVQVHVDVDTRHGDLIRIVAWSMGGCWSQRAWHVACTLEISTDEYGEVRLTPYIDTTLAVRGQGGTTVFEDPEYGAIGPIVARWYLAWEGRRTVRGRLGVDQPELPDAPITLEQFLALPLRSQE
ncbi:hypothetical protein [Nonomuraea glycinis]|uniref:hypothetical protein n=1 Tax=Nonomuraea glycinis TaxID=2047744 RepID=UPI0033A0408F